MARGVLTVALLAMVAGLYACAPKITKVDASYTMPEGVMSQNSTLITWIDQPTTAYVYKDRPPADPDSTDSLMSTTPFARYSPNVIHGMIIDNTAADAFQMFRRESGGGVRKFTNYDAPRTRQWVASQYESYHFIDVAPSNFLPSTYIARGVVAGVVSRSSPLTNLGTLNPAPLTNIHLKAVWWNNTDAAKGPIFRHFDTAAPTPKIKLSWNDVPGAVRYLLQVYEYRGDLRTNTERILSGTPAPFYDGQATEDFMGYIPAGINYMFVGDSTVAAPAGVTVFQIKPFATGASLIVRMTALDVANRMIGLTMGDQDTQTAYTNGEMGLVRGFGGPNTYMLYRLNATTSRDTTPARGGGPGGGGL